MELAKYECIKCKYAWETKPGMVRCPQCDHEYVLWLNYPLFELKHTGGRKDGRQGKGRKRRA